MVQKLKQRLKLTTDRQTNKQTGQKQYAPDHLIPGHKGVYMTSTCLYLKLF